MKYDEEWLAAKAEYLVARSAQDRASRPRQDALDLIPDEKNTSQGCAADLNGSPLTSTRQVPIGDYL
jgi:hypothetical protein